VLQAAAVIGAGLYTIVIGSASGAGFFDAQFLLNAQIEIESTGGPSNDAASGAQNLDSAFVALDAFHGGQRAAAIGLGDGEGAPPDFYSLTLRAGQRLTLGGDTQQNGNVFMQLWDAHGNVLALGGTALANYSVSIVDFIAPADGTYFVRIIGDSSQLYNLVAVKDAQLSTHANFTADTAQPLGPDGLVLGNVSGSAKDASNFYSIVASAGDVLTIRTVTPGGPPGEFFDALDATLSLFDANGTLLAANDNSAPDRRNAELHYAVSSDGVYTIAVGVASGLGEYVLSVDGASAPAPADAPRLLAASDSGISASDRITNFNNGSPARALRFSVTNATAGATVQILADGVVIGSAVAGGAVVTVVCDGKTTLPDGIHSIVARQTLANGTVLADSSALPLTIITAVPPAPAAPQLDAASDSGTSSSDAITKMGAPLIDIPTPLYWQMFRDGVAVSPAFSPGQTFQSRLLVAGTYHFTLNAIDTAGNVSAMGMPLTVVIDQKPPTVAQISAPTITAPGGASYQFAITFADVSGVDISSIDKNDILVTGPLGYRQVAALVSVSGSGKSVTATYMITAPPHGWAGIFSGTYNLAVQPKQVSDIAGNAMAGRTIGTFKVSIPLGPPLAPALSALSDRGSSQSDGLTNLNNANSPLELIFIVTDTLPGATVTIYADGIAIGSSRATAITTAVLTNGRFKLSNGKHRITARQTPAGGRQTADSVPLSISILNQQLAAPAAPVLAPGQDSGISTTDGLTNINNLTFYTKAGPIFRLQAGGKVLGDPFTKGTVATTGALPDGTYNFVLVNVDNAGNESAPSLPTRITIDSKAPTIAPPGSLDSSFGKGGVRITSSSADQIIATALQSDGKIVAAGTSTSLSTGQTALKIVRYKSDGTLDATFGSHGIVLTSFGTTADTLTALAIQADGKILIAGDGPTQFIAKRFLATGAIDNSFGANGQAAITVGGPLELNAMLILSTGAILLGGQIDGAFGLMRLNAQGVLDQSFGAGGSVVAAFPGRSPSLISSLALGSGGAIVAAGTAGPPGSATFAVARFTGAGKLDTTFGSGGFVTTNIRGASAARRVFVQSDGRITVVGTALGGQFDVAMARYHADGSLDFSFGVAGIVDQVVAQNTSVTDAILQSDGRIVVAGNEGGGLSFVFRFVSDGAPDPIFGSDGLLAFGMSPGGGSVSSLLRQSSGNLMLGGQGLGAAAGAGGFALARVRGSGTYLGLDPSNDSGISNADGITNISTPLLDLVGRGSSFYRIYIDGNLASASYATAARFQDLIDLGDVTFTLVDAAGNESPRMPMAPVTLDVTPPGIEQVLGPRQITTATAGPYTLRIIYGDDTAIDFSSLADGALVMSGPNGFSVTGKLTALLINDRNIITATYQFTLPPGGFDGSNNGNYTVSLQSGALRDPAGNAIAARTVLQLAVNVTP
jgi:uncharacterized delta-60 repeat protein